MTIALDRVFQWHCFLPIWPMLSFAKTWRDHHIFWPPQSLTRCANTAESSWGGAYIPDQRLILSSTTTLTHTVTDDNPFQLMLTEFILSASVDTAWHQVLSLIFPYLFCYITQAELARGIPLIFTRTSLLHHIKFKYVKFDSNRNKMVNICKIVTFVSLQGRIQWSTNFSYQRSRRTWK